MAFSPSGRQLAEGLCRGAVVIADGRTGRVVRTVRLGGPGGSVAYSPDGSILAATSLGRSGVLLIDPTTGRVRGTATVHPQGRMQIAFSPDGRTLAIAGNGQVTLWDVRSHRSRVLRFPPAALGAPTSSLSFSRDGKRLAVGLHQIAMSLGLMVLDVVSGRALATARASVDDVAFSPDGRSVVDAEIALTSGGSIVLRDAATLAPRRTLTRMPDVEATAAAFSPDRADVAFGGADGTAGLTSVGGQRVASYLGQTAAINRVAFTPDGRLLATASCDGTTRVWRATAEELRTIPLGGSPDGIETTGGVTETLVETATTPRHPAVVQAWSRAGTSARPPLEISPTSDVDALFLSGDGRLAGVIPLPGGRSGVAPVQIWSVAPRRIIRTLPRSLAPFGTDPVFSPDNSLIAMGKPGAGPLPGSTVAAGPSGLPQPNLVLVDARTGKTRTLGSAACGAGWRACRSAATASCSPPGPSAARCWPGT